MISLHTPDNPNHPCLHVLNSPDPDFIAPWKIFPPYCFEWRLWSGNALPRTSPHLLGLRMEECGRLWRKTSLQLHILLPPDLLLALSLSRIANPRRLSRWDAGFSPHTFHSTVYCKTTCCEPHGNSCSLLCLTAHIPFSPHYAAFMLVIHF